MRNQISLQDKKPHSITPERILQQTSAGGQEKKQATIHTLDLRSAKSVKDILQRIPVDPSYIEALSGKLLFKTFLINNCDNRAANLLKQEMLNLGAEAAVSRDVSAFKPGTSSVLLGGTEKHFYALIKKLPLQPFGLKRLAEPLLALINSNRKSFLECRGKKIPYDSKPLIMGILNMTPDSFHDGGQVFKIDKALERAYRFADAGVNIIDVGGESSRPGSDFVSENVEKRRVLKVIEFLAKKDFIVSIDTRRSGVAQAALDAGASIINDISALRDSPDMAGIAAQAHAGIVLMHMKGTPKTMQAAPVYGDVIEEVKQFLDERVQYARACGIGENQIILDPGIGFGKTLEHNIALLKHIRSLIDLGYPIMLGASRKSFIGTYMHVFDGKELSTSARLPGSLAVAVSALIKGVRIFRVHDVQETRQALTLAEALQ